MSCKLKKSTSASENFTAPVGADVAIRLEVPEGADAEIVHIRYAGGELDSKPPFEFTIQKGPQLLVVLVEASKVGVQLALVQECEDGDGKVLSRFRYNPKSPARGYIIKGVKK